MPTLHAKPNPLEINFQKSAILVVDMQNAFASPRGMLDIAGLDISGAARVTHAIRDVPERRPRLANSHHLSPDGLQARPQQ